MSNDNDKRLAELLIAAGARDIHEDMWRDGGYCISSSVGGSVRMIVFAPSANANHCLWAWERVISTCEVKHCSCWMNSREEHTAMIEIDEADTINRWFIKNGDTELTARVACMCAVLEALQEQEGNGHAL